MMFFQRFISRAGPSGGIDFWREWWRGNLGGLEPNFEPEDGAGKDIFGSPTVEDVEAENV